MGKEASGGVAAPLTIRRYAFAAAPEMAYYRTRSALPNTAFRHGSTNAAGPTASQALAARAQIHAVPR